MANVFSPTVTAVQVGNFFVGQYYQVLQGNPDVVHQFYTDASNMTLIDGSLIESATAMLDIHALIMSLNFKMIEIKTAHSTESWNGGVLVVVQGFVHKENDKRSFVQTFFLAPQEKGYFVLNDIFQFIDEKKSQQHPTAVLEHEQYNPELNVVNPVPEPVADYVLREGIQNDDFVPEMHAEVTEAVDTYSAPEPEQLPQQPLSESDDMVEEAPVEERPASYPSSMNVSHDPLPILEQPVEEPIKHTYASILRTSKATPRLSVPQQSSAKSVPMSSEWDDIPQPAPVQQTYPQPVLSDKSNIERPEEFSMLDDEGEVTSVYVRNLPSTASASELEQEFKNFGKIKPDGVLIKSRKEVGVYYAFVEFEDISGVHNAVKASPIQYSGRQIHVEERRPNAGPSRGRRGRGRGGYQPEGPRGGRIGGRSTIRDYSGRSRGNGYIQRGSSRGILGPQGLRNGN